MSCLSLLFAMSLHLGLENDYNPYHPQIRCTQDQTIYGGFNNSEKNVSLFYGNKYKNIEEKKFRLKVRPLYPTRKFVTSSNFLDTHYFTSKSFYSLEDYATEEVIIPFSSHSKLSADSEGMYINLLMNG